MKACFNVSTFIIVILILICAQIHGLLHPTHALLLSLSRAQRASLGNRLPTESAHVRWLLSPLPPTAAIMRQPAVSLLVCSGSLTEVQEAVIATKPVLAIPSFVEQRDVANRFYELGVAMMIDGRRMDTALIAWSAHILMHNSGYADSTHSCILISFLHRNFLTVLIISVRDRLARLSLLLRSSVGTRVAANLIELNFGLMRHLFAAADVLAGSESRERSVHIPSTFAYTPHSILAPLPTLYRYNGYSFSLLPGPTVPTSTTPTSISQQYNPQHPESPSTFATNYDSSVVNANGYALLHTPSNVYQLPWSLMLNLQSPDLNWPWYRRYMLDVLAVCALLFALISLAIRACWSGCGAVLAALKAECAK